MKFAVAGVGSIGRRHLRNLLSLGEKDIILFRSNKSTLPDDELASFPVVHSIEALFDHHPDAIIISNPTALHLEIAIPAAKNGCHLFIEKPITNSFAGVEELKTAVETNNCKVLVGFHYRYHPTLNIAEKTIKSGEIGRVVSIHAHWGEYLPDWHPWEDYHKSYAARRDLGGGVVLTLCHPIDYVNWLFGKPTLEWSRIGNVGNLGIEVEDIAEVSLRFPGGAFGFIHLDYLQNPPSHFVSIIGTEGVMYWNNTDGKLIVHSNNNVKEQVYLPQEGFERNSLFVEEMRHFISVVKDETSPKCTLDDGITALDITLKLLQQASIR